MIIHHRPMVAHDARYISALVGSADELGLFYPEASFPLIPDTLPDEDRQRHWPTVALDGDRVVGYVDFIKVREKRFCTFGHLVVGPAVRRRGVGSYLVRAMTAIAAEQHAVKFVKATCFSHNTAAYQMFHALGFRPVDMAPKTDAGGETVLVVNMMLRHPVPVDRPA